MLCFRWCVFILFAATLAGVAPSLAAAKKKQDKAFPAKVIKASDTQFKHAKIVQPKPEKKRFLWFKKKEEQVVKPKRAPIADTLRSETVLRPRVEPASSGSTPRSDLFEKKAVPQELIKVPEAEEQRVEAAGLADSS